MTDERIDHMMDVAVRFYWDCPVPGIRAIPVMIAAAVVAREMRKRRLALKSHF
jgi:hypothetical protein